MFALLLSDLNLAFVEDLQAKRKEKVRCLNLSAKVLFCFLETTTTDLSGNRVSIIRAERFLEVI